MKTLKKKIGQKIKERRKELGFATQAALAEAVGTDQATVGRWESGIHTPSGEYLERIYEVLKIDESYFSGNSSDPQQTLEDLWKIIKRQEKEIEELRLALRSIPSDIVENLERMDNDDWQSLRGMMGWKKPDSRDEVS